MNSDRKRVVNAFRCWTTPAPGGGYHMHHPDYGTRVDRYGRPARYPTVEEAENSARLSHPEDFRILSVR